MAGMVITVDRGRFTVRLDNHTTVYAIKARELGRKGIVTGDRVDVVGDLAGHADSQARIVRRLERTSNLRRTADDADPVERVIVANATQLGIVTSTINPDPNIGFIDRALVAAADAGVPALLIITKCDLHAPDDLISAYLGVAVTCITVTAKQPSPSLLQLLTGQRTVLIGPSGVGKSTLVNALVPGADRGTGGVNTVTGKGRHTSTSAMALELQTGGWIIDTPGIRSFGLAHVSAADLIGAFPELALGTAQCPRACSHDEQECALDEWAAANALADRLAGLRRLLRSMAEADRPHSADRNS